MARKPDVPCATCGNLMYGGRGCLPAGQSTCQPCRRAAKAERLATSTGRGTEAICRGCLRRFIRQAPTQHYCWNPCRHRRSGTAYKAATATERGYGEEHRRAREQAIAEWQDGDPCARCDGPMHHGEPVDLDHNDDRTGYLGLSHRACNRSHTGRLHMVRRDAVCEQCGVTYRTRWEAQRYCSVPCTRASRASRPRRKPLVVRQLELNPCKHCGSLTDRPSYCSDPCYREAMRVEARTRKRLAAGKPIDAPVRAWRRRPNTNVSATGT